MEAPVGIPLGEKDTFSPILTRQCARTHREKRVKDSDTYATVFAYFYASLLEKNPPEPPPRPVPGME